ncbi:TonB-dependent receptor, partial [bacterium]|nr:TonB-dependent receptor [bacterium]
MDLIRKRLLKTTFVIVVFLSVTWPIGAEGASPTDRDKPIRFSLRLKKVSLRQAIKRISEKARVEIIFSDKVVRDLFVTAEIDDLPVEKALTTILTTTELAFEKTEDNHFVLFKKSGENKGPRKIAGVVIDAQTKKPLARTNISLTGSHWGTTTDEQGHFSLDAVPGHACTLRVAYIGYASQTIAIPAGEKPQILDIKLAPILLKTPAITVEHKNRAEVDMIPDIGNPLAVSGKILNILPRAMGEDILKTAEFLPGISSAKDAASGFFIRGGTPSQTLVLLDGIPIYNHAHSFGLLSAFSTDIMQELRLYKGVLPARYGGRLSGIMELNAKSGDFRRFRVRSNSNLTGTRVSTEIPLAGRGSWLISARRSYSSYMLHNLHDQIFNNEVEVNRQRLAATSSNTNRQPRLSVLRTERSPQFNFYDWIHRVTFAPTARDYIAFTAFRSHDKLVTSRRVDYSMPLASDTLSAGLDFSGDQTKNETNSLGYSGRWSRKWGDRSASTVQFVVSEFARENRQLFLYPNSYDATQPPHQLSFALEDASFGSDRVLNRVREYIFNLDNEVTGRSQTLDFGVEVRHTTVRDSSVLTSSGSILDAETHTTNASQTSFYAENSWNMNERLQTDTGFRLTAYSPTNQLFMEPRFNLRYMLSEKLTLRAASGQSMQVLNMVSDDVKNGSSNNLWVLSQRGEISGLGAG